MVTIDRINDTFIPASGDISDVALTKNKQYNSNPEKLPPIYIKHSNTQIN